MTRPVAASFARIVTNIAGYRTGIDTVVGVGSAMVEIWRPVETSATWVFTLIEVSDDLNEVYRLGTIAMVPTQDQRFGFDVLNGDGTVCLADFRGPEAAIGFALDELCADVWRGSQNEHDPVAV